MTILATMLLGDAERVFEVKITLYSMLIIHILSGVQICSNSKMVQDDAVV